VRPRQTPVRMCGTAESMVESYSSILDGDLQIGSVQLPFPESDCSKQPVSSTSIFGQSDRKPCFQRPMVICISVE
jgi:hypothetical protein